MLPGRSTRDAECPPPRSDVQGIEEPAVLDEPDTAGDPPCLAHLVCPACGAVITEGHRPSCHLEWLGDD